MSQAVLSLLSNEIIFQRIYRRLNQNTCFQIELRPRFEEDW